MMKGKKAHLDCGMCDAMCCKYVALQIDTPRSKDDFEDIKWYVTHQNVKIFVETKQWFLEFQTPCEHIGPKGKCLIYDRRPKICKGYGWSDEGDVNCHISDGTLDHEYDFKTIEQIEEYYKKRYPGGKKRNKQ